MDRRDLYAPPPPPPRGPTRISRRRLFALHTPARAAIPVEHAAAKARALADAERGEHWPLVARLGPAAEILAEAAGVGEGDRVLDAAAGDGNVARACLARGARVWACDLSPAAVRRGSIRTPEATWTRGDVEALPYDDDAFDVVLSGFGVVHAPRPVRALTELARVCRPGGRVALTSWVPRGLPGRLPEYAEAVRPLPLGVPSATSWGRQDTLTARLSRVSEPVSVMTRTLRLEGMTADELFRASAPGAFTPAQRDELRPAFDRLLASSSNRADAVELDARYVVAVGHRRHHE